MLFGYTIKRQGVFCRLLRIIVAVMLIIIISSSMQDNSSIYSYPSDVTIVDDKHRVDINDDIGEAYFADGCVNEYILTNEEKHHCPNDMNYVPASNYITGYKAPIEHDYMNKYIFVASYCIDLYEYPNKAGEMPKTSVSQFEAHSICKKEEKRLCSEREWEKACRGPCGYYFPYGYIHENNVCNTLSFNGGNDILGPPSKYFVDIKAIGSYPECVSYCGVYDLSGNTSEWLRNIRIGEHDADEQIYIDDIVLTKNNKNQLYGMVKGGGTLLLMCGDAAYYKSTARYTTMGFRCCKDIEK